MESIEKAHRWFKRPGIGSGLLLAAVAFCVVTLGSAFGCLGRLSAVRYH